MSDEPDLSLTMVLLAPYLLIGGGFVLAWWLNQPARPKRTRRLTDAEVRAMYRISYERAKQGQWN